MRDDTRPDTVDAIEAAWRRERPDVEFGSIGAITRVYRLARHLERARARALAGLGTDQPTLETLGPLRRAGPPYRMTSGELQRASLVTSGAVSQRLERLEREGLVIRLPDPDDRRGVIVELTLSGHELIERVVAELMRREEALLAQFSADERATLVELLRRWLRLFEPSG